MQRTASHRFLIPIAVLAVGITVLTIVQRRAPADAGAEPATDGGAAVEGPSRPGGKSGRGAAVPGGARDSGPRAFVPPDFPEELDGVPAAGIKEAEEYVQAYRKSGTSALKSDQLAEVRSLELEDYSVINNLLIMEAVHGDELVREAARTALKEYGGARAAETLERYLQFDDSVEGRTELEEIVEFMRLPSIDLIPGGRGSD